MNNIRGLFLMIFPLIIFFAWLGWKEVKAQGADWFPINYVRVEGAFQHITEESIKQLLSKQVSAGLYNADIQQISESVEYLSWAKSVTVKRVWPDAIDIKIKEQEAIFRWKEKGLINKEGEIFIPENRDEFSHLPLLTGPVGNEKQLLEEMKRLSIELRYKNLWLTEFKVSDRRAWVINCGELQLIAGRNKPLEKVQRFLKTIALIGEPQMAKVAVVDLRYPNGYTLKWKEGTEEINWKEIAVMRQI
jgi:cell division protein FtsQ